ncbi:MAG: Ig-like domain-containing protein [Promethearchaeota archaeon]
MRVGFALGWILLLILFPVGVLSAPLVNDGFATTQGLDSSPDSPDPSIENLKSSVPIPGPDLGTTNWTSNHIQNPDFEDWSDAYSSEGWTSTQTGDRHHWIETTKVSDGSYGAGFHCYNYPDQFEHATLEQSTINADFSNISLSFDWYLDQNNDPSEDAMYAEVQIQDGTHTYWLFYYLNGSSAIDQNSTWEGYYVYNMGPAKQWNSFSRNLTADFLAVAELQGSYSELLYVDNIRFHLETFGVTLNLIRGYIDNMKLLNHTDNHYFINQTMRNGNFETGDFTSWSILDSSDAGHFERSSSSHTGSFCANATAYSIGNTSEVTFRDYPYVRLTSSHQGQVNIWWYLTTQNLTSDTYAYIVFEAYDGVAPRDIYYLLSYGGSSSPLSNGTTSLVLKADQFNTTGTWNRLSVNLWTEALSHYTLNELMVDYVEIVVIAEGPEALMSTLIDDFSFRAATLNHRDFEDQPAVGQQVQGFTTTYSRITVTSTAYGGSKAGNLTLMSGSISFAPPRLPLQWRPLNSSRETYLDVMWRIVDTIATNQVWLRLTLTNGHELNYYINGLTTATSNTSSVAYFNVTDASTLGSWVQMHRDLVHDYEAAFGSLPDTTMELLYMRASTSARLEFLFDDLYLYDDPAPTISNVGHTPLLPEPEEIVDITTDIVEQDLVTATLYYRVDGGGWQTVEMTPRSGDTYNATIPNQVHNAVIEYYVTASDDWGLTTTALNGESYWTYIVTDQTAPTIDTIIQTPLIVNYLDSVNVSTVVTEVGSGLQSIQLFWRLNGGAWNITSMIPTGTGGYYVYIGAESYSIFVEYFVNATDNAGLQGVSSTQSYTVTDTIAPEITNRAHSPAIVEYTDNPTVQCNVTDAASGLATVVLYYQVDSGIWNSVAMTPSTGTGFGGTIPAQAWNSVVHYYVNATDNEGNWITSSGSYTVEDNTDPVLQSVMRDISTVQYNDTVGVSCETSDVGSGLTSVVLYYRNDSGSWYSIGMTDNGTHYNGVIPVHPYNLVVEYYITATDNAGNAVSSTSDTYTVCDDYEPIISNVAQWPVVVLQTDTPEVSCDVFEDGSSIDFVILYYRFNGINPFTAVVMGHQGSEQYNATLPQGSWNNLVEYYITANDTAGNSITDDFGGLYYSYTIGDSQNPSIQNVSHTPLDVEYNDNPLVECDITDVGSGIQVVVLWYRVGTSGPFTPITMTDTGLGHYTTNIPAQPYSATIQYYINASDWADNFNVNPAPGSYYSYTIVDITSPSIFNVYQSPTIVEGYNVVLLFFNVTDYGSGLNVIQFFYRIDGGNWITLVANHISGDQYGGYIPGQPYNSFIEYYVNATDNANNIALENNGGNYFNYTVVDTLKPAIWNVDQIPIVVEYDDSPTIGCNATDLNGSGIQTVTLYYRTGGIGAFSTILMTDIGGNQFTAPIPVQPYGTLVEYFVNATDFIGNWIVANNSGNYYSYTVGDVTDPLCSISVPEENSTVSGLVSIEIEASDAGSGIARIVIAVDGEALTELTSLPFDYSWDSTSISDGSHTITVTAIDNAGNQVILSIDIVVQNAQLPPPIPGFPVGAIVLGLTLSFCVIAFVRRRRRTYKGLNL